MSESTKERPGEYDALEKARPDELIFTLLERDPCAPPTILHWCDLRRTNALKIKDRDARKQEFAQITNAELIAFDMRDRQQDREVTTETVAKPLYSGMVVERSEIEELMPKLRSELAEADYHANNALELARRANELDALDDADFLNLQNSAKIIHEIVMTLSPHRAAYLAEQKLPLEETKDD